MLRPLLLLPVFAWILFVYLANFASAASATSAASAATPQKCEKSYLAIGKEIGNGDRLVVYRSEQDSNLVVKRLRASEFPEQAFLKIKQEHELVHKYFGDEFVPQTQFITLDESLNVPAANIKSKKAAFPKDKEFLMVQQKVTGTNFLLLKGPHLVSQAFKEKIKEFIRRYRKMQASGFLIEDQVMIDLKKQQIWVYDTNHLFSFTEGIKAGELFFKANGIATGSIKNSKDLYEVLRRKIPELQKPQYDKFSREANSIIWSMLRKWKMEKSEEEIQAFRRIVMTIDTFPPEGDNDFAKELIQNFHLDI